MSSDLQESEIPRLHTFPYSATEAPSPVDGKFERLSPLSRDEWQKLIDDLERIRFLPESSPFPINVVIDNVITETGIFPTRWLIDETVQEMSQPEKMTGGSNIWRGNIGTKPVCLKRVRGHRDNLPALCAECLRWSMFDHPNVLAFLGLHPSPSASLPALISPYMANGTIVEYLKGEGEVNRLDLLSDIAGGLAYMHGPRCPLVHGDICGDNVLINDEGKAVICDYSSSTFRDPATDGITLVDTYPGSVPWMAPEALKPCRFLVNEKIDVWSFGCLCVEVFTGRCPYAHLTNDGAVVIEVLVNNGRPPHPGNLPSARQLTGPVWALMERCWQLNPAHRPPMDDVCLDLGRV